MSRSEPPSEKHEIDEKRDRMLELVHEQAPSKEGVFLRTYTSNSRKAAVNAHCLECMGFETRAIRECTSTACGLHNVRPYQGRRGAGAAGAMGDTGA